MIVAFATVFMAYSLYVFVSDWWRVYRVDAAAAMSGDAARLSGDA